MLLRIKPCFTRRNGGTPFKLFFSSVRRLLSPAWDIFIDALVVFTDNIHLISVAYHILHNSQSVLHIMTAQVRQISNSSFRSAVALHLHRLVEILLGNYGKHIRSQLY